MSYVKHHHLISNHSSSALRSSTSTKTLIICLYFLSMASHNHHVSYCVVIKVVASCQVLRWPKHVILLLLPLLLLLLLLLQVKYHINTIHLVASLFVCLFACLKMRGHSWQNISSPHISVCNMLIIVVLSVIVSSTFSSTNNLSNAIYCCSGITWLCVR